jgi:hypothetical protein
LKAKRKFGNVCIREHIGDQREERAPESGDFRPLSRFEALAELRATYVPPHLRAAQ